ncbi:hypothetical protein [Leucobacter denitrificans]|uniref:Class F sortase n=1 Tax=Leucobacter denitrificans TaxID=683042 RepID=A0A7G9S417_9MICO|nr:hypothetical protein [Leucobacter denitrificans]QNN62592.1 hypothetical protein H9L06_10185 [Leucobacter denitrificans]
MSDEVIEEVPKGRKRRLWWYVGGAAALVALAAQIAVLSGLFANDPGDELQKPVSASTRERDPHPEPKPEPEAGPESPAALDPDLAVNIENVREMPYSSVWRPADEGQGFWQIVDDAYGYPRDGGTDFILAHSCDNRDCAGDELRTLEVGETLTYEGDTYTVEDKRSIMKDEIASQDIWTHDPNRLVIVTCIIETTWEFSDKNEIFIATKTSG